MAGIAHKGSGFTLIELSIVLVIIGLIVGGVLVGQDLIRAASVRATVTQIEKYNSAVNTFRAKYNALPGDIAAAQVAQLGFTATPVRAGASGRGDGDGAIVGFCTTCFPGAVTGLVSGEAAWFWDDLANNSGLIEGSFTPAPDAGQYSATITSNFDTLIPPSKLGRGLYVYVFYWNGQNYYGMSQPTSIDQNGALRGNAGMTVSEAAAIDKKMDDGLPQSGNVFAYYENWDGEPGLHWAGPGDTSATSGSVTTCYDNGGNAGSIQKYSLDQNRGSAATCGLTFHIQ